MSREESANYLLRRLWGQRNMLTARDWKHVRRFLDGHLESLLDPEEDETLNAVLDAACAVDVSWPRRLRKDGGSLLNERLNALSAALDAHYSRPAAPTTPASAPPATREPDRDEPLTIEEAAEEMRRYPLVDKASLAPPVKFKFPPATREPKP